MADKALATSDGIQADTSNVIPGRVTAADSAQVNAICELDMVRLAEAENANELEDTTVHDVPKKSKHKQPMLRLNATLALIGLRAETIKSRDRS